MTNKEFAEKLLGFSKAEGCIPVLAAFGGNIPVQISLREGLFSKTVEGIGLASKYLNRLRRNGCHTIGQLSEVVAVPDGLGKLQGIGVKAAAAIKTALLDYCYESATKEQRLAFWENVVLHKVEGGCA